MSTKYKTDLDLFREYFAMKGQVSKSGHQALYEKYINQMVAKDSKKIMEAVYKADKSPLKNTVKELGNGLIKMYRNAGIGRGLDEKYIQSAAKDEAAFLKAGFVHPAISEKTEQIIKMGGKIERLESEKMALSNKLGEMKGKFKEVSGKLNNLIGNLLHKEGFSQSKIESYQKESPSQVIGKTEQISEGKTR